MNKRFKLRLAGATSALVAMSGSAMAALPPEATAAIADMKGDGALLAGAFLVVCIAIGAIKILKKGAN